MPADPLDKPTTDSERQTGTARIAIAIAAVGSAHGRVVHPRRVQVLAKDAAALLPSGRLIDVGCGDGLVTRTITEQRPDIRAEGFDVLVRDSVHIPVQHFDGRKIPLPDDSADAVLLVDVLHHADDPIGLLAECGRVAPVVVVKDHVAANRIDYQVLAFMDWVGNRPHGVVLPYSYFSPSTWREALRAVGLREADRSKVRGLYPFPFSLAFGRSLHFFARLERVSA